MFKNIFGPSYYYAVFCEYGYIDPTTIRNTLGEVVKIDGCTINGNSIGKFKVRDFVGVAGKPHENVKYVLGWRKR